MQLDVLQSFISSDVYALFRCFLCTILNVVEEEEIRSYCYLDEMNHSTGAAKNLISFHWFSSSLPLPNCVPVLILPFPSSMTSIIDPAFMTLVEQQHSKLLDAIENVENNREKALSSQKQELQKIHADEIERQQQEIRSLKLEIITLQEKIASDERVCTLESERDFYRKESMRLNATVETLKSKLDKS